MAEALVLDASALVEALIGTEQGRAVRTRLRGAEIHAPAHLDAEVLSALGRLHRAGDLGAIAVVGLLEQLERAPILRHPLQDLLIGAWAVRDQVRLVDALYLQVSHKVGAPVVTTDARLAGNRAGVELIS